MIRLKLKYIVFLLAYFIIDIDTPFFLSSVEFKTSSFGIPSLQAQEQKRRRVRRRPSAASRQLNSALIAAKEGDFAEASRKLFSLRTHPDFANRRGKIYYLLGLMLYKMDLYQVSAFQFSEVISRQDKKYLQPSIEKLIRLTSEILNSDAVLNYSLGKINLRRFPKKYRDQLQLRVGEAQMNNKQFGEAIRTFRRVGEGSLSYPKAKYLEGLAYVENDQPRRAFRSFANLLDSRSDLPVNDSVRATALMGMARVSYQQQDWNRAIELYRRVPRDTEQWFDSLFEITWAQLRAAQLRFALGNFHSLHSPYYEANYQPESLILRAILYLYICQYDEMEKTLNFFEKVYFPERQKLRRYMNMNPRPRDVYKDFDVVYQNGFSDKNKESKKVPYIVAKSILREGNVKDGMSYITQVKTELEKVRGMPANWQSSKLGNYAKRLLTKRIQNAQLTVGKNIDVHMRRIRKELAQMISQHGLARYEMLNAKKDTLKTKIASKANKQESVQAQRSRSFYVQGGYEYWPFQGEYWLDELGNYYYLGVNSCERSVKKN